jgi:hypothetical protein
MAAFFASLQPQKKSRFNDSMDSIENRLSSLPPEKDREYDIELGMLMLNG